VGAGYVVADVLPTNAREWYWVYWPRDLAKLTRELSHVVVAGTPAVNKKVPRG